VLSEGLALGESVSDPQCRCPSAQQGVDEVFAVLVVPVVGGGGVLNESLRDRVRPQPQRGISLVEFADPADEVVAVGGPLRAPLRDGQGSRLAFIPGPLVVVTQLGHAHERRVRVALRYHPASCGRPGESVGVLPSRGFELVAQIHTGQTCGAGVGAVGADLPSPVALTNLPLTYPLPGRVVDNQGRVDTQQHCFSTGV
jgi:hypothetical protein